MLLRSAVRPDASYPFHLLSFSSCAEISTHPPAPATPYCIVLKKYLLKITPMMWEFVHKSQSTTFLFNMLTCWSPAKNATAFAFLIFLPPAFFASSGGIATLVR